MERHALIARTMNAKALENFLHTKIPLSRAMRVRVTELRDDCIALSAPLRPNWNHQRTAFGGSIATLGTLAGWSLIHARLEDAGIPHNLVVQRQEIEYMRPITGALIARTEQLASSDWQRFLRTLKRHKKASLTIVAELEQDEKPAAQIRSKFVALVERE